MEPKKNKKLFYGWIVTILAGLTYFGSNGLLSASSGTIISQLLVYKGWDPASVSLTYTIKSFIGLSLPLIGLCIAKFGPRLTICVTTVITAICLAATGWVNTPMAFIMVYGIAVSLSMLFNDQLACFTVVTNWWERKRGQQSGIVQAMGALGGVVFPPLITVLFLNTGWKQALIIMAVLLLVITALPQFIWMKDRPEQMGLHKDGMTDEEAKAFDEEIKKAAANADTAVNDKEYRTPYDWDTKDAVRTPQLWLLALAWGFCAFGYCVVMYFGMTHMIMNGFGDVQASTIISVMSAAILIGALVLGPVVDRIPVKYMYALMVACHGLGFLVCELGIAHAHSYALAAVGAAIAGLADGPILSALMNALCRFYGPKNYAKIQPYCNVVVTLLCSLSSLLCGWVLSNTGSLSRAFYVSAAVCFIFAIVAFFVKAPKLKPDQIERYKARDAKEAEEAAAKTEG
ncbi:MAG: MFS transporter [Eubacterium sp.]|nr:MFS transporter [Eubacterium sp.]